MIADKLIEVDEDTWQATPTGYARTIDSFLHLITRDRGSTGDHDGRKKRRASKEFAYIYFMYDIHSPFFNREEQERHNLVKTSIFGEDSDWEPDESVQKAAQDYRDANETISRRLLRSSYTAVEKVRKYLDDVDLQERDDRGKPIHSVKDVMKAISDLGQLIDGLESIEERIQREETEKSSLRGGVEETEFNT